MTRGAKDRLLDILSATTEDKNSRVMLAHEYFRINGNQVLDIARTDIPFLQSAVREVLERP